MIDKEEKRKLLLCAIYHLNDLSNQLRHYLEYGFGCNMEDEMDTYLAHSDRLSWINNFLYSIYSGHSFKGSDTPEHLDKRAIAEKDEEIEELKSLLKGSGVRSLRYPEFAKS